MWNEHASERPIPQTLTMSRQCMLVLLKSCNVLAIKKEPRCTGRSQSSSDAVIWMDKHSFYTSCNVLLLPSASLRVESLVDARYQRGRENNRSIATSMTMQHRL